MPEILPNTHISNRKSLSQQQRPSQKGASLS